MKKVPNTAQTTADSTPYSAAILCCSALIVADKLKSLATSSPHTTPIGKAKAIDTAISAIV
jgi:hypothetical protein